ncbi:uncharacterized protein Z520_03737 [Fonsecaea multimorphosa CBS 102226]|uniref:Uncharacterized protein n=1 Tax=Fonsecaea multimorphosa CBS 102226 TaxID=1442371 RepID=A0A0D2HGN6_9EURO|nr:uncharacterized protein Z520_03737 [Fonsecaea multimorphosa CBS 102226]KIY01071.1 hypothetical protein Z520_03737 [Fonsecaea multimorphosa CBS 102226]
MVNLLHKSNPWADGGRSLGRKLLESDRCADEGRSLGWKLLVLKHYSEEAFWLDISPDLNEVKQFINGLKLPQLQWYSDTLASFQFKHQSSRQYIRLGFLQRLKQKEMNAETRSVTSTIQTVGKD